MIANLWMIVEAFAENAFTILLFLIIVAACVGAGVHDKNNKS